MATSGKRVADPSHYQSVVWATFLPKNPPARGDTGGSGGPHPFEGHIPRWARVRRPSYLGNAPAGPPFLFETLHKRKPASEGDTLAGYAVLEADGNEGLHRQS
jgi:hypothetical protein